MTIRLPRKLLESEYYNYDKNELMVGAPEEIKVLYENYIKVINMVRLYGNDIPYEGKKKVDED